MRVKWINRNPILWCVGYDGQRVRERKRERERAVDRPSISHRDHENFTMLEFQNVSAAITNSRSRIFGALVRSEAPRGRIRAGLPEWTCSLCSWPNFPRDNVGKADVNFTLNTLGRVIVIAWPTSPFSIALSEGRVFLRKLTRVFYRYRALGAVTEIKENDVFVLTI